MSRFVAQNSVVRSTCKLVWFMAFAGNSSSGTLIALSGRISGSLYPMIATGSCRLGSCNCATALSGSASTPEAFPKARQVGSSSGRSIAVPLFVSKSNFSLFTLVLVIKSTVARKTDSVVGGDLDQQLLTSQYRTIRWKKMGAAEYSGRWEGVCR